MMIYFIKKITYLKRKFLNLVLNLTNHKLYLEFCECNRYHIDCLQRSIKLIEISQSFHSILFVSNELFSKKVKTCESTFSVPKAVERRCPVKKVFLKILNMHKKTPEA